jgi:DNA polymerase III delta prime subunit
LLQGPPGTGKTRAVVALLQQLGRRWSTNPRETGRNTTFSGDSKHISWDFSWGDRIDLIELMNLSTYLIGKMGNMSINI